MKEIVVKDPVALFASLGGLHDCRISGVNFDTDAQRCSMELEDLNSNFADLPGYRGERGFLVVLEGVVEFRFDVETNEGIRINNAVLSRDANHLKLEIDLNLGGGTLTKGRRSVMTLCERLSLYER